MRGRKIGRALLYVVAAAWAVFAAPMASAGTTAPVAPELSAARCRELDQLASLTLAGLRGRPVLVEFWTSAAGTAQHPALGRARARAVRAAGLTVIAVHTPDLAGEHERPAVANAVNRLGIRYPVLIDDG